MQRQQTATVRPGRQDRRPWLIAACSAALLAAVAVGTWQTVARREGTTTTPVEQTTASTSLAPAVRHAVTARSDSLTVYVVGSEEEAARVTAALRAGDEILAQLGQPPFAAQVVVAATAEEWDSIAWANAEAEAIRATMGLPPISVLDLRAR